MSGKDKSRSMQITVMAGVDRNEEQEVRATALKQLASWLKRAEIGRTTAKRGEQA